LDAVHLATALLARENTTRVALLSLDDKVRENGQALGFDLRPSDEESG
jgi:hypothetical protein